jgi:hypothetical protein
MLEYLPRDQFVTALIGLCALLTDGGSLLLFMTRDNWLMRPMIGRWWRSNLYTAQELKKSHGEPALQPSVHWLAFALLVHGDPAAGESFEDSACRILIVAELAGGGSWRPFFRLPWRPVDTEDSLRRNAPPIICQSQVRATGGSRL